MNEENSGSQKGCDWIRGGSKSRFVAYLLGILHIRGTSIAGGACPSGFGCKATQTHSLPISLYEILIALVLWLSLLQVSSHQPPIHHAQENGSCSRSPC